MARRAMMSTLPTASQAAAPGFALGELALRKFQIEQVARQRNAEIERMRREVADTLKQETARLKTLERLMKEREKRQRAKGKAVSQAMAVPRAAAAPAGGAQLPALPALPAPEGIEIPYSQKFGPEGGGLPSEVISPGGTFVQDAGVFRFLPQTEPQAFQPRGGPAPGAPGGIAPPGPAGPPGIPALGAPPPAAGAPRDVLSVLSPERRRSASPWEAEAEARRREIMDYLAKQGIGLEEETTRQVGADRTLQKRLRRLQLPDVRVTGPVPGAGVPSTTIGLGAPSTRIPGYPKLSPTEAAATKRAGGLVLDMGEVDPRYYRRRRTVTTTGREVSAAAGRNTRKLRLRKEQLRRLRERGVGETPTAKRIEKAMPELVKQADAEVSNRARSTYRRDVTRIIGDYKRSTRKWRGDPDAGSIGHAKAEKDILTRGGTLLDELMANGDMSETGKQAAISAIRQATQDAINRLGRAPKLPTGAVSSAYMKRVQEVMKQEGITDAKSMENKRDALRFKLFQEAIQSGDPRVMRDFRAIEPRLLKTFREMMEETTDLLEEAEKREKARLAKEGGA